MKTVYLDHNATSPLDPRIADAMAGWSLQGGNPSSLHAVGRAARERLEEGRQQVSDFLGAEHASEIVFGGSGTELNNAVLATVGSDGALEDSENGKEIVVASFEHPSVLAGCERLERRGWQVTRVAPGSDGVVSAEAIEVALTAKTRLVSLMLANNEIGTVQPVAEVARLCRKRGVLVLCDAVQAAGKIPVGVQELGVDYLVIAGHKFNGPMGAAALWVRPGAPVEPLLVGGAQERHRRASTENVAANAGLGMACALAGSESAQRMAHFLELRDYFETSIAGTTGAVVNCAGSERLPTTSSVRFDGINAQDLLIRLDLLGFAVSTGSACASGSVEASPTLLSLGLSSEQAMSTLRVSFGMTNSLEEIDAFLKALEEVLADLRGTGATGPKRFARSAGTGGASPAQEVSAG